MTNYPIFLAGADSGDFIISTADMYPFLPVWAAVLMAWAIGLLIYGAISQKTSFDTWGLLPVVVSLVAFKAGAFTAGAIAGALCILLLSARFFLLLYLYGKRDSSLNGFNPYILIHGVALVFMLLSLPVFWYIYSRPDFLVAKLKDRSVVIENRLVKLGKRAEKDVIAGLSSKDPKTSAACARIFRHLSPPPDAALLYPLLLRKDERKGQSPRIEAVITLSAIGGQSSVEPVLISIFENLHYLFMKGKEKLKYSGKYHRAAINAVKEIENRTGVYRGALIAHEKSLQSKDPFVVTTWGLIGVELGGGQSLEAVTEVFGRIYKDGKLLILDSIKEQESYDALNILFMALKDPSDSVRLKAVEVLKTRGELIVIFKLAEALDDSSREMRVSAYGALKSLTGEDLGFDPDGGKEEIRKARKRWLLWWVKKARQ